MVSAVLNILLLEIDLDAVFLQLPDGGQGIDRVPRKAADGLGDDQVDLAVQCISDHAFEAFAVLGAGARDALVGVRGRCHPGKCDGSGSRPEPCAEPGSSLYLDREWFLAC